MQKTIITLFIITMLYNTHTKQKTYYHETKTYSQDNSVLIEIVFKNFFEIGTTTCHDFFKTCIEYKNPNTCNYTDNELYDYITKQDPASLWETLIHSSFFLPKLSSMLKTLGTKESFISIYKGRTAIEYMVNALFSANIIIPNITIISKNKKPSLNEIILPIKELLVTLEETLLKKKISSNDIQKIKLFLDKCLKEKSDAISFLQELNKFKHVFDQLFPSIDNTKKAPSKIELIRNFKAHFGNNK